MLDDCIENYLEFKDEEPETLIHQQINDMTEIYGDYRKVSIFKKVLWLMQNVFILSLSTGINQKCNNNTN